MPPERYEPITRRGQIDARELARMQRDQSQANQFFSAAMCSPIGEIPAAAINTTTTVEADLADVSLTVSGKVNLTRQDLGRNEKSVYRLRVRKSDTATVLTDDIALGTYGPGNLAENPSTNQNKWPVNALHPASPVLVVQGPTDLFGNPDPGWGCLAARLGVMTQEVALEDRDALYYTSGSILYDHFGTVELDQRLNIVFRTLVNEPITTAAGYEGEICRMTRLKDDVVGKFTNEFHIQEAGESYPFDSYYCIKGLRGAYGTDGIGNVFKGGIVTTIGSGSSISIGSTVGSGTSGSLLYVDASGDLAQENATLFYDDVNNALRTSLVTGALTSAPSTSQLPAGQATFFSRSATP